MALEWNGSGLGYPDKYVSIEGYSFSVIINDAGRKAKKSLPGLNWPGLLGSCMLTLTERAVSFTHSAGVHADREGEMQADLQDWRPGSF